LAISGEKLGMTVRFQALGNKLVLVLDRSAWKSQGLEAGTNFRLEIEPNGLILHRLPEPATPEPAWTFEAAQAAISAKYATAFRVLAR
jgi:hypothetical protein